MSSHYDIFIKCDFKENTPETVIDYIRFLTTPGYKLKEAPYDDEWHDYWDEEQGHFLVASAEEERFTDFRAVHRHVTISPEGQYTLTYYANNLLDDGFHEEHLPFVHWIAKYVKPGFIGYYKEHDVDRPRLMFARSGELKLVHVNDLTKNAIFPD